MDMQEKLNTALSKAIEDENWDAALKIQNILISNFEYNLKNETAASVLQKQKLEIIKMQLENDKLNTDTHKSSTETTLITTSIYTTITALILSIQSIVKSLFSK